jgi:uncharacterized protein involved in outer membrane biogenesis
MTLSSSVSKLAKILLALTIILAILQAVLIYVGFSFTSDYARKVLLEQIEVLTDREVAIDGEVRITVSMFPELVAGRIHVKNDEGYGEPDFITLSEARVQLALLPLLTGNIHVTDLVADRARIGLIAQKGGGNNWSFDHLLKRVEPAHETGGKVAPDTKATSRITIERIKLTDSNVQYRDQGDGLVINKHFAELVVDLEDAAEPQAHVVGSLQDYPYTIGFESDSLKKLSLGELWKISGSGTIAGREAILDASIRFSGQDIEGQINANVKDIDLGQLLAHAGIITDEDAAARELQINVRSEGANARDLVRQAKVELHLKQGYWRWQALLKDETRELSFNAAALRISWTQPVELNLDGALFEQPVRLELTTNRLSEFFDDIGKLDIDLSAHVAGSDINLKGNLDLPVKKKKFQLDIALKGHDLEKLNRILNTELPPFNNYYFKGKLSANKRGFVVKAEDATIGNTHFKTAIVIDTSSLKPFWTINLESSQLQIKDFEFADLKVEKPDGKKLSATAQKARAYSEEQPGHRLLQTVDNPKMHFDLNLKVDKVLAGETALGASSLRLKLRDKTLIMDDADLSVPGGRIKSSAAFTTENDRVDGVFKLDIDRFDYGAVARYFEFGSSEGGVVSARIDLRLRGKDFSRLFDHATGKLDVALWPRNTQTQIFDVWANSLFLIILPEIKKREDKINCIVALMDLEDGMMKEDFLGIDTRKVWMHGNIQVDFKKEHLQLSLYPRSKKARLFAVQTPIRAEGNFDDIGLTTNPVDLTVAYLSFITSPLHVPARRVLGDRVPEDASEICEQFFDRDFVKKLKQKIEQEEQKEIDEWLDSD